MPCYTIQSNTVDVGKMSDALLKQAAIRNGWRVYLEGQRAWLTVPGYSQVTVDRAAGTLTGRGADATLAGIVKRAYSGEVVRYSAALNGWKVKVVGANRLLVIKG